MAETHLKKVEKPGNVRGIKEKQQRNILPLIKQQVSNMTVYEINILQSFSWVKMDPVTNCVCFVGFCFSFCKFET